MRGYVPCGACSAYVSTAAGCKHWKPGLSLKASRQRERRALMDERTRAAARERATTLVRLRRQSAKDKAAVEALRNMLSPR